MSKLIKSKKTSIPVKHDDYVLFHSFQRFLQEKAESLIDKLFKSMSLCSKVPIPAIGKKAKDSYKPRVIHKFNPNKGTAWVSGLIHCKSKICFTCARLTYRTAFLNIQKSISSWMKKAKTNSVWFLTLTASHKKTDDLKILAEKIYAAKQHFFSKNKTWLKVAKMVGCVAKTTAVEINYNFYNGYHPHFHILLFIKKDGFFKCVETILKKQWIKSCAEFGLVADYEHGLKLEDARNYKDKETGLSNYLTKLSNEIVGAPHKETKKDGLTMWGLAWNAFRNNNLSDLEKFFTIGSVLKNKPMIVFSKNFKSKIGFEPLTEDEVRAMEESKGIRVAEITSSDNRELYESDILPMLLNLLAKGKIEEYFKGLDFLKIPYINLYKNPRAGMAFNETINFDRGKKEVPKDKQLKIAVNYY